MQNIPENENIFTLLKSEASKFLLLLEEVKAKFSDKDSSDTKKQKVLSLCQRLYEQTSLMIKRDDLTEKEARENLAAIQTYNLLLKADLLGLKK